MYFKKLKKKKHSIKPLIFYYLEAIAIEMEEEKLMRSEVISHHTVMQRPGVSSCRGRPKSLDLQRLCS